MNNKGNRNKIQSLKYKKRVKLFKAMADTDELFHDNALRTTGKPCSCWGCSPKEEKDKYKRKHKGNKNFDEDYE